MDGGSGEKRFSDDDGTPFETRRMVFPDGSVKEVDLYEQTAPDIPAGYKPPPQSKTLKIYAMETFSSTPPHMPFIPSTDKQKGMLAHQLTSAHDGAFNLTDLPRELLEDLKRLNEQGDIDKYDTSHLIDVLVNFNDARYEMNPRMIESTKQELSQVLNRIARSKAK